MSVTWGSERLHRSHTYKASSAWSLGSRTQGMAFPEAGVISGEVWRRWSRMGLERHCMPAWVRFWHGAICVVCSRMLRTW